MRGSMVGHSDINITFQKNKERAMLRPQKARDTKAELESER